MSECMAQSSVDVARSRRARERLSGRGAIAALEERLRAHYDKRHALCLSSATTALHALALALDLRGAEFVTTPYTYGASLAGWLLERNRPVFADIEADTLTLDARAVAARVTRRTRALLAVDIFGVPCDDGALRRVADAHGLWYAADASQSFGATRDGRPASALADALVLSFTTGKPLDAGEGGAVLTDHDELYEKLLWFTQHPERQRRELGLGVWNEFGLNGRMHPLAARLASRRFDAALDHVRTRQERSFQIIEAMNRSSLTEPIDFWERRILPSFFRLTGSWRRKPRPRNLEANLACLGWHVHLGRPPVTLVYQQPAFRAQYGHLVDSTAECPVAERQWRRRVSVEELHVAHDDLSEKPGGRRLTGEGMPDRSLTGRRPATDRQVS